MSTPAATNTVLTLGVQGPPGVGALNTTLSSSFTIPALSNTTVTNVVSASGVFVGAWVTVQGAGTFYVNGVTGNQLVLLNAPLAYPSNSAAGTVIASGATVISSGPPGPQGPTGPQGPAGSGGYTPPTGTGFPHITGGAQDGAARAVNLASADVSGTLPAANVGGVNGVTVASTPAGSGLALVTTSTSSASWTSLGAGFTAGGDLSGTSTSQQVQSLTGASGTGVVPFPAAATGPGFSQGSTTAATGANMSFATQASTATNGSPGNLVINLPAPTGTGARAQFQVYETGNSFPYFSVGHYPFNINYGALYLNPQAALSASNYALLTDSSSLYVNAPASGGFIYLAIANAAPLFTAKPSGLLAAIPVLGDSSQSSPYGVHGDVATAIATTSALTAAQYAQGLIRVAPTAAMTLSGFPLAASAAGYPKELLVSAAFAVTVSDGTHTKTLPAISGLYRLWFTSQGIYGGTTAL